VSVLAIAEGYIAGGSIPCNSSNQKPCIVPLLRRWEGSNGRGRAMPHIKTYTRYATTTTTSASDQVQLAWTLVTSANLSKPAWGELQKENSQLYVASFEIGCLFLPSLWGAYLKAVDSNFAASAVTFSQGFAPSSDCASTGIVSCPLPYVLPPKPYGRDDHPWAWDKEYSKPDVTGRSWEGIRNK